MKHLYLLFLLLAATAQAQIKFPPRRCLHTTDSTLITHQNDGRKKAMNASTDDGLGKYGTTANGTIKSIGHVRIPVIMTAFKDKEFLKTTTREKVGRLFNENGYADERNCVGSVRDYFIDNSGGMFVPEFVVVDSITVSNTVAYYGKNSGTNNNANVRKLVPEAVELAQANGVNFSQFVDGTGVPIVIIYHAGQGEHNSYEAGSENYLWAHYSNYSFTKGGVKFNSYFVGNETSAKYSLDDKGNIVVTDIGIDGCGIMIHELGHALGLPDIYSTAADYYGNELNYKTPDWWSVMDYGEYYANTYRPVGLNAYEKSFLGWLDVKELTQPQVVTLEAGESVLVRNPKNPKEYYLLENRQTGTWYPDNYGTGMLVMHVDYDKTAWTNNRVNNTPSHLRVTVKCADGEWTGVALDDFEWGKLKTDLYGYLDQPDSITEWECYTGAMKEQPIYNIEQKDGKILFSYIDNIPSAVEGVEAAGAGSPSVYTLDGRRVRALVPNNIYIVNGKKVVCGR